MRLFRPFFALLLTIYLCFSAPLATAAGQGGVPPQASAPANAQARVELQAALTDVQAKLKSLPDGQREESPLKREESLLQQLLLVLSEQDQTDQRIEETAKHLASPLPTPEAPTGDEASFALFDRLRGELVSSIAEEAQLKSTITEATRSKDEEEKNLDRLKRAARQRDDQRNAAVSAEDTRLTDREIRLSEERIKLSEKQKAALAKRQELQTKLTENVRARIGKLTPTIKFSEAQLEQQLSGIRKERERLNKELRNVGAQLEEAEKKFADTPPVMEAEDPARFEERRSYQVARDFAAQRVSLLNERLNRLGDIQDVWSTRHKVLEHAFNRDQLREQRLRAEELLKALERAAQRTSLQSVEIRREQLRLKDRADSYNAAIPVAQWLGAERRSLESMIQLLDDVLLEIDADQFLTRKLLSEIQEQISSPGWKERLAHVATGISAVWSYELLTTSDDKPITVKKIVLLMVFLALAVVLSRRLSRTLGHRFLPRLGISSGASAALESLAYYAFVVFFALLGLHFANVPLTLFTVLGGAFAIGIGFGSQAVLNNFLSSLIVLVEQLVRPGDLIEIEGRQGQIRRIGARSTTLHTADNVDVIIPNSDLLQKHVINWTLADARVKIHVEIPVFQSIDYQKAESALLTIAREHPAVLNNPQPDITLKSFTETSMVLEMHVWILVDGFFQTEQVRSDLRTAALKQQQKKGNQ